MMDPFAVVLELGIDLVRFTSQWFGSYSWIRCRKYQNLSV